LRSNVKLVRISLLGGVFSGPLVLAIDLTEATLVAIRSNVLRSLIPPPRLRLSECIKANKLPEVALALPGSGAA
jgi:hypothetical protein